MDKEDNTGFAQREFDLAWKAFFRGKPKPRDDDEEKKQMEEFAHWYNYTRKQSDTGKTPAEMYKDEYGKEPIPSPNTTGRMINFDWDKSYNEDNYEDEEIMEMKENFDKEVWPRIKQETKEMTKREACFTSFLLGFETMKKITQEEFAEVNEKLGEMTSEEIGEIIEKHYKEKAKNKLKSTNN
ncbi:hypothetical protein HYV89_05405 [Candidatus Woesearchaeota archaeon]|nr:hypothetical protein [Candidatus Woesearchaeota archaeon]